MCSRSIFTIKPDNIDLPTASCSLLLLKGMTKKPGYVEEDFYCHANIEGCNKRVIIMTSIISATFVEPCVEMTKPEMNFRIDIYPGNIVAMLRGEHCLIIPNLVLHITFQMK